MSKKDYFSTGASAHEGRSEGGGGGNGASFDPRQVFRYYIPKSDAGETQLVMLLDDEPFNAYVHQYEENGNWGNWLPCPVENKGFDDRCPLCERGNNVKFRGHFTMVDISGWEGDNDEHRMGVKILPAKSTLVSKLETRRKEHGTLQGAIFKVIRNPGAQDNTGDDWMFHERMDLDEFVQRNGYKLAPALNNFPEEWGFWEGEGDDREYHLRSFPWTEVLDLMTYDEMQDYLMGGSGSSGGGSGSSGGGSKQGDLGGGDDSGDQPMY